MGELDLDAARAVLENFIVITRPSTDPQYTSDHILEQSLVVEAVLDALLPNWRRAKPVSRNSRWHGHREMARKCLATLNTRQQIEAIVGNGTLGPELPADRLHPWVWDAARPQWESGIHGEAVHAAARNLNSRLQQKVGRRNVSDAALVRDTFSLDPPAMGRPRLRVAADDGSETYRSLQQGVSQFGQGCFQAIRNPAAHEPDTADMEEAEALERLAALSLFARWIDDAV